MNNSKIAVKMKEQMGAFSGILSEGLPKTAKRLVKEVILGVQARQSVRLTEISRFLNEPIPLTKTQNRICRQLKRKEIREVVRENLLREGSRGIKKDSLLLLDTSDITKKYARKMEYLASVRDGSENKIGRGYWTIKVVGAELEEVKIRPLYGELYSQEAPEFCSENEQILTAIVKTSKHTRERGIWVIDRGADRRKLIGPLLERKRRFIIRLVGNRHLVYRGKKVIAGELAEGCRMMYAERLIKEEEKKEKSYHIEFGYRRVKLPGYKEQLYLVVVKGFGQKPMMLLTNVEIKGSRKSLLFTVLAYVRRWQIEDTIRFAKQSYCLEDIRLLTYERLKNMMVLVMGAMYFAAVWLGDSLRLQILAHHALKAAKRLFGIPNFRYYALADGIKEIFAGYSMRSAIAAAPDDQTWLFDP